jgi:hypothetical protein
MRIPYKRAIIAYISRNARGMYNRKLKKFSFDGEIGDDSLLPRKKQYFQKLLEDQMRESGYVPVLDIDPQFFILYNSNKDTYDFNLALYGVFVGKKKCLGYVGYSGQSLIPKA